MSVADSTGHPPTPQSPTILCSALGTAFAPTQASAKPQGEGRLFTQLQPGRSRWKSFLTGWGVQAVSFIALFFVSARLHEDFIKPEHYRVTPLVSYEPLVLEQHPAPPIVARSKPLVQSKPVIESKPAIDIKPAMEALVVTRQAPTVAVRKAPDPEPIAPAPKFDSKMPVIPAAPTSQVVAVGTFSHESPVTAPVAKLASVQTAGFGNSSGGNGSGHGTGMSAGSPSVVASAGFGNGAIETTNGTGGRHKAFSLLANGANSPVEITFKPKPDYTDEGRKQKINGEVRLEVVFRSDGRVRVMRVIQGLGFGLDEEAVKAAEHIKFKPALHDGQPTDSTAMVHIIFELIS